MRLESVRGEGTSCGVAQGGENQGWVPRDRGRETETGSKTQHPRGVESGSKAQCLRETEIGSGTQTTSGAGQKDRDLKRHDTGLGLTAH